MRAVERTRQPLLFGDKHAVEFDKIMGFIRSQVYGLAMKSHQICTGGDCTYVRRAFSSICRLVSLSVVSATQKCQFQ